MGTPLIATHPTAFGDGFVFTTASSSTHVFGRCLADADGYYSFLPAGGYIEAPVLAAIAARIEELNKVVREKKGVQVT